MLMSDPQQQHQSCESEVEKLIRANGADCKEDQKEGHVGMSSTCVCAWLDVMTRTMYS